VDPVDTGPRNCTQSFRGAALPNDQPKEALVVKFRRSYAVFACGLRVLGRRTSHPFLQWQERTVHPTTRVPERAQQGRRHVDAASQ
jgi:hypothetical protein